MLLWSGCLNIGLDNSENKNHEFGGQVMSSQNNQKLIKEKINEIEENQLMAFLSTGANPNILKKNMMKRFPRAFGANMGLNQRNLI